MAKLVSKENEAKITDALDGAPPRGFTIQELSKETGLSRLTVTKCIIDLVARGVVNEEEVGNCRLITLAKRA